MLGKDDNSYYLIAVRRIGDPADSQAIMNLKEVDWEKYNGIWRTVGGWTPINKDDIRKIELWEELKKNPIKKINEESESWRDAVEEQKKAEGEWKKEFKTQVIPTSEQPKKKPKEKTNKLKPIIILISGLGILSLISWLALNQYSQKKIDIPPKEDPIYTEPNKAQLILEEYKAWSNLQQESIGKLLDKQRGHFPSWVTWPLDESLKRLLTLGWPPAFVHHINATEANFFLGNECDPLKKWDDHTKERSIYVGTLITEMIHEKLGLDPNDPTPELILESEAYEFLKEKKIKNESPPEEELEELRLISEQRVKALFKLLEERVDVKEELRKNAQLINNIQQEMAEIYYNLMDERILKICNINKDASEAAKELIRKGINPKDEAYKNSPQYIRGYYHFIKGDNLLRSNDIEAAILEFRAGGKLGDLNCWSRLSWAFRKKKDPLWAYCDQVSLLLATTTKYLTCGEETTIDRYGRLDLKGLPTELIAYSTGETTLRDITNRPQQHNKSREKEIQEYAETLKSSLTEMGFPTTSFEEEVNIRWGNIKNYDKFLGIDRQKGGGIAVDITYNQYLDHLFKAKESPLKLGKIRVQKDSTNIEVPPKTNL